MYYLHLKFNSFQPHDEIVTTETIHKFPKTTKVQVANINSCSRQGAGIVVGDLPELTDFFGMPTLDHHGWRLGYYHQGKWKRTRDVEGTMVNGRETFKSCHSTAIKY